MVNRQSETATMLDDRSIAVHIEVWDPDNEDNARGHGDFEVRPDDADYESVRARFELIEPGDCLVIESISKDGVWIEEERNKPRLGMPPIVNL